MRLLNVSIFGIALRIPNRRIVLVIVEIGLSSRFFKIVVVFSTHRCVKAVSNAISDGIERLMNNDCNDLRTIV
jgi:hypothetical protein